MNYQKRRLPWVLIVIGAVMALCALVILAQTKSVLQYCVTAPELGEKGENIKALQESAAKVAVAVKDEIPRIALSASCGTVGVSLGDNSVEANLIAIGEGWPEVYTLVPVRGWRISDFEIRDAAMMIMLDEGLAFKLFGMELPENASVTVENQRYRVIGIVRHAGSLTGGRGVGDKVEYDAYIPLLTAAKKGIKMETLTLSGVPLSNVGSAKLLSDSVKEWKSGGELIDLYKEAMRRTILPRILLLIVGLYALYGLFRRMTEFTLRLFDGYREALKLSYFNALIPRLLGIIALTLLGYAALIGATYMLMVFSSQPLYVFTEWVPESFVKWSSITKVFWELTSNAASTIHFTTRELRVVSFWGGVLRWGLFIALLGVALLPKARSPRKA